MILPNSRAQPDVYLATKLILQPRLTVGHSLQPCPITEHRLSAYFTIKPCLWPCQDTELSQSHHLVGEHNLRPPPHQQQLQSPAHSPDP